MKRYASTHVWLCVGASLSLLFTAACKREKQPTVAQVTEQVYEEPGDVAPGDAFAMAEISNDAGLSGRMRFMAPNADAPDVVNVLVSINGAPAGRHGLHVHEFGDCTDFAGGSAGKHWSMGSDKHGGPSGDQAARHTGDLGNIEIASNGVGAALISVPATADVRNGFIGKGVILHAKADDLTSQPSGDSGDPIACGVITATDILPVH